jgi:hypothetical protein
LKAKAIAFIITVFAIGFITVSVHAQSWHIVESWTGNLSSETNQYFYLVHGPFTENGLAYNGLVNVIVSFEDQSPLTFALSNGADYSFSSQHRARTLFWNLTTDYNKSRQISFGSSYSDEVYLYVANTTTENLSLYYISVTDMVGLTNATVEMDKNVLGVNRVIERQLFDPVNVMSFYLLRYHDYTLKVISDQGTFTWDFPTDSDDAQYFAITKEMITAIQSIVNATAWATRWNGTFASVYFNDPSHLTTAVTTNIYIMNLTGQYLFYTQTDLGYVQSFTLNSLDANTKYLARTVTAQGSWSNPLPIPSSTASIWGVSFDVFGDWSSIAKNAIGMFVVMTLISVGSWKDTEWFLGAGIVVAAFLVSIGFMSIPWAGISAALLVVVLMYIDKGKKEIVYS